MSRRRGRESGCRLCAWGSGTRTPFSAMSPPVSPLCHRSGVTAIHALYDQVSYNCFIAAGLYFILGGFCFCQVRLNKRKEYLVR